MSIIKIFDKVQLKYATQDPDTYCVEGTSNQGASAITRPCGTPAIAAEEWRKMFPNESNFIKDASGAIIPYKTCRGL